MENFNCLGFFLIFNKMFFCLLKIRECILRSFVLVKKKFMNGSENGKKLIEMFFIFK